LLSAALAAILMVFAAAAPASGNWLTTVDTHGGGHAIGNPQAKVKLTEFVSYTCPHCGHFEAEAANAVDLYVATGKVQVDVRHVVRDPVDLTAAMLANCGPAIKFPRNHATIFAAQPKWLPAMARATTGQTARWTSGPGGQRRRAIASDLGFYDLMATRGYERVELDRCLNDEALAKRIAEQSAADDKKWGVSSTPTFAIDGTVLAGTWTWDVLRPQLDARL
jgi:protein-disulfide isomerase